MAGELSESVQDLTGTPEPKRPDPFSPSPEAASLYISPALQQRIDLVGHLIEFGRQIIVLSGPAGIGKSCTLEHITRRSHDNWQVVSVHAGPGLTGKTIFALLAKELGLDDDANEVTVQRTAELRQRLTSLEQTGKLVLLVIDDAHSLSAEALTALVALAHNESDAAELRVLMAANLEHGAVVENLQRELPNHALVHVVEIPRLTPPQIQALIEHRLRVAGLHLETLFDAAKLAEISEESKGIPGRVNVLARQHLAPRPVTSRRPQMPSLPPFNRRITLMAAAAVVLLLVLGGWLSRRAETPVVPTSRLTVELPHPAVTVAPAPVIAPTEPNPAPATATLPPTVEQAVIPDTTAPGGDLTAVVSPLSPPAATVSESKPGGTIPMAPKPEPAPRVKPVPPPVSSATPGKTQKPATPQPSGPTTAAVPSSKVVVTKPESPAAGKSAEYSLEWLKKQPKGAYTLQLLGVRDKAAAQRFVTQRGIQQESVIGTTTHDGKPLYVVIYGYYTNRQMAAEAAAKLSARMPEVKPWVRNVDSLEALGR